MFKKPSWQTIAILSMVGLLATFLYLDFRYFEQKFAVLEQHQKDGTKVLEDVRSALAGQERKIEAGEPLTAQAKKQSDLLEKQSKQIGNLEAKTTRLLNVVDRSVKVLDKVKTRQDGRGERIGDAEELLQSIDKRVTALENSLDPKVKPLTPREKSSLKRLRQEPVKRK